MSRRAGKKPERVLWHFTCDHGRRGIGTRGQLEPNTHPLLVGFPPIIWLTSASHPTRDSVGLTSTTLNCDRMAHRYRVLDTSTAVPWASVADEAPADVRADLERYSRPSSWWVSFVPVPVELT